MSQSLINHKPTWKAWAFFDWSNSAYNLVITSTIFPAYYTAITHAEEGLDYVNFFGFEIINTVLSNSVLGFAYLIMAFLLPVLSSIADFKKNKMQFMKFFTWMGAIACMGLFFFRLNTLEWGMICFAFAAMGYIGGLLFNNAYLPEIASPDQQDKVSAMGFSYGYVGCVTLQILCFILILKPEWFGIEDPSLPARISFLMVGLWWIGFSQIPFRKLPKTVRNTEKIPEGIVKKSFKELKVVYHKVQKIQGIKKFLPAYFFYSIGVQTLMVVAAAFGEKILNLGATKLIGTILLIQLVAIIGANVMARLSTFWGNVRVLMLVVCIWISICIGAFYLNQEWQFYLLAALVGLVMGGIQSLSRSTYSKLIPVHETDTASFFSFYDVTEKIAIVCGLFTFAFIEYITEDIRYSALSLAFFFFIGLYFLWKMKKYENSL